MVVKFELTDAQARDLFWYLKGQTTPTSGPLSKAHERLLEALEAQLGR